MMLNTIAESLRNQGLTVETVEGTLNITKGRGPMARRVNVDPSDFFDTLEDVAGDELSRQVSGYARGIDTVLLEPKRSDAADWTFVESAGSILPSLEVASFNRGVRDATGGDDAWTQPLSDGIVVAWVMRMDRGVRVITEPQFERWGVTADRVKSAGRSLLFHSTRSTSWKTGDWKAPVRALRVGDGFDAGRIFVVEDMFFSDVDRQWRFSFPDPDLLLAVDSPEHHEVLRSETERIFGHTDDPLSDKVWQIRRGSPELVTHDD